MLHGVMIPKGEGAIFGEKHVPDKPNATMNCEQDWSMLWRAYDNIDA